mmetsp:Transcript_26739/g.82260  ORF Transcript_26739/g.82260 Transcript_26739/m.82260 type:complete len:93 (-) Transcript_26739:52-330(-)
MSVVSDGRPTFMRLSRTFGGARRSAEGGPEAKFRARRRGSDADRQSACVERPLAQKALFRDGQTTAELSALSWLWCRRTQIASLRLICGARA